MVHQTRASIPTLVVVLLLRILLINKQKQDFVKISLEMQSLYINKQK